MNLNEYQKKAAFTADFKGWTKDFSMMYLCLGLAGESGEVIEKVKHVMRDSGGKMSAEKREQIKKELGDVLWYLSQIARMSGLKLDDVATTNIKKLRDRRKRGVIKSEGDTR